MKLIAGLGNPEKKHQNNRHNAGFRVIDKLAEAFGGDWVNENKLNSWVINSYPDQILLKPMTFMNASGEAVSKAVNYYKVDGGSIYVIHDDLDIRLGEYKIQKGTGPKVHNGLNSIYQALGTKDFWHVRVGVDNRDPENRTPGEIYVLQNFNQDEEIILNNVVENIVNQVLTIVKNGA